MLSHEQEDMVETKTDLCTSSSLKGSVGMLLCEMVQHSLRFLLNMKGEDEKGEEQIKEEERERENYPSNKKFTYQSKPCIHFSFHVLSFIVWACLAGKNIERGRFECS